MFVGMAFLIGVLIGFGIGWLCYRNNKESMSKAEKDFMDIAGKFKGDRE